MYDGCKRKIEILEGYLSKLADIATIAPKAQDGDGVEFRLTMLDQYTEKVMLANSKKNFLGSKLKELERLVKGQVDMENRMIPKG